MGLCRRPPVRGAQPCRSAPPTWMEPHDGASDGEKSQTSEAGASEVGVATQGAIPAEGTAWARSGAPQGSHQPRVPLKYLNMTCPN